MSSNRKVRRIIGHYTRWGLPLLIGGAAGVSFLDPDSSQVDLMISVAYLIAVLSALWCMVTGHEGHLCPLCAKGMPLVGAATAERQHRWLRLAHLLADTRIRGPLLIVGGPLLYEVVKKVFDLSPLVRGSMSVVLCALPLTVVAVAFGRHGRLQLWCPYCRREEGDDEESLGTHDPSPVNQPV